MDDNSKNNESKSSFPQWIKNLFVFIAVFVGVSLIGFLPGIGFLRYYIDGSSINRRAFLNWTGEILWETPQPVAAGFNNISNNHDAAISSDGKTIIFSHKFSENNSELYVSRFKNGEWSGPALLKKLNSKYDEKNPVISDDGRLIYFSSNRPGGKGGFDILCSIFDGNKWTAPFWLGGNVNSEYDDIHPELAPQNDYFYFSSNRPYIEGEKNNFNIYRAARIRTEKLPDKSGPPAFKNVEYLYDLNTPYDEGKLTVNSRGSLFYFCSDRPGGQGGFDLYRSHAYQGGFTPPANFGIPINTEYDEISPIISMEGFKIFFSSNRYKRSKNDYRFYESLSHQVAPLFDYSILLAVFIFFASIILIYLMMKILLSNVDMKMITKCLLASLLIHLLLLLFSSAWFIGGKIKDSLQDGPDEMTINVNNLARENINIAIREGIASLPKAPSNAPALKPQSIQEPSQQRPKAGDSTTEPTMQSKSASTPVAIAESTNIPEPGPSSGEKGIASLKPSVLGRSSIKMETPAGKGKKADGASKGKGHTPPKPKPPTPPAQKKQFKVVSLKHHMDMGMPDMGVDTPELNGSANSSLKKQNRTTPSMRKSVARNADYSGTSGKDSKDLELPRGIRSNTQDSGMLLLVGKIKMEGMAKTEAGSDLPELGLLKKDSNLANALVFEVDKNKKEIQFFISLKEILKMQNMMLFPNFAPLQVLFAQEQQLTPVGDVIYKKMSGLNIPTDSELEAPEEYNQ